LVPSAYEPKRAPKRTQTSFSVLDLDLHTQGESFAGTTLLSPVEEGYESVYSLDTERRELTASEA
jgi:hypothetical protein